MQREMRETRTQPQRTVTDWPSVRERYSVVEKPYGTATGRSISMYSFKSDDGGSSENSLWGTY